VETENLTAVGEGFVGFFNLAGDGVMRLVNWIATGTLLVALMFTGGCADQMKPMTDTMKSGTAICQAAVEKASGETLTKMYTGSASGSAINPGVKQKYLVIAGYAVYVEGTASLDGISAQGNFNAVSEGPATTQPYVPTKSIDAMTQNARIEGSELKQVIDKAIDTYRQNQSTATRPSK
jgi:hypothetical protein